MKQSRMRLIAPAVLAVAAAIFYQAGRAPKLTREARAQALSSKLNFNQGLGFYAYSDGQLTWLKSPTEER